MTAVELVATLQARGVGGGRRPGPARFRPGEAVTSEERCALRKYKAQVLALLEPLALDPLTLQTVLGPRPNLAAVAVIEAEVRAALQQYRVEVATGVLGRGVLTVQGRPLSDYLDLDTVARLLGGRRRP